MNTNKKNIETYAAPKCCELCGAEKSDDGTDPRPERSGAEVIRRLAFIADTSPALAILLIHHIAGRTEREIAVKLSKPQSTIHSQIARATRAIRSVSNAH